MSQPIGKQIMRACEAVERFGGCNSPALATALQLRDNHTRTYLGRAMGYGLLTVDRSSRTHQYQVVPGWRERVKPIARVRPYVVRPRVGPAVAANRAAFALAGVWGAV